MIISTGRLRTVTQFLVTLGAVLILNLPGQSLATIWHVPTDPGAASIEEALGNAEPEDTVLVAPGTYYEHDLVVPHAVYLWGDGESPEEVVIDAQALGRVLAVPDPEAFAIWIRNLTLTGGDSDRGGAFFSRGQVRITECRLMDNEANYGGGLFTEGSGTDIIECHIVGNHSRSLGGGLYCRGDGHTLLQECALIGNEAAAAAGGWYVADTARLSLPGTTLADNRADLGAEGGSFTELFIFYEWALSADNHPHETSLPRSSGREIVEPPPESVLVMARSSIPFFVCCVRYNGGFTGPIADQDGVAGNVTGDPLFCKIGSPYELATYYGVAADSPCLPENSSGCGLVGVFEQACEVPVTVAEGMLPRVCVLHAPIPNPFNPMVTLSFSVRRPGRIRLKVFDLAGHRIATLVDRDLPAGDHETVWRGRDDNGRRVPSGVYLCQLAAGGDVAWQRFTLVK